MFKDQSHRLTFGVEKMKPGFFAHFTQDWKPKLALASAMFCFWMWYAMAQHIKDIWLLSLALAIGSWEAASYAVLAARKWKEWRRSKEEEPAPWQRGRN